ncbi:MAG TPA: HEAT repeat domain-containing protein, partial [Pirellulaceae bacterium]|nr:HEAT repeat domain-containing protein [Pirellulaceae bacterium]
PDGSAIEQVSWGQVNPFGMCFDRWGNQFTADCHSKPITMLLRGGYYESFGKPHDGLGFAPVTTRHDHDSTGIAGVAYYDATNWPAEYRHCFYVGNVITNVVHRDVVQWRGSSPWVEKPVDFVVCDDPWFHPVDLQVGPDGALYISDFYNAIIGHYEVDLKHPRRDRTRGRIWRVVYRGEDGKGASPPGPVDFTQASEKQLVSWMGAENIAVRAAATRQAMERPAATALAIGMSKTSEASPLLKAQAVWLAASRGELDAAVASEKSQPSDPLVRVQLCRAVGELSTAAPPTVAWLVEQLKDGDPFVKRAAADALSRHPRGEHVAPLLEAWQAAEPADEQLVHTLKLAVRRQLTAPGGLAALASRRGALPAAQLK